MSLVVIDQCMHFNSNHLIIYFASKISNVVIPNSSRLHLGSYFPEGWLNPLVEVKVGGLKTSANVLSCDSLTPVMLVLQLSHLSTCH